MWNMHRNATLRVRPLNGPTFGKQVQVQRWQHDLRTGRWLRVSIAVMQESERELFAELDVLSRWSLKWSDWHDRASNRHCIWTSRYLTCPIGLEIDLKGRSRSWFRGYDWRYILWKQRLGLVISSIFFVLVKETVVMLWLQLGPGCASLRSCAVWCGARGELRTPRTQH